MFRAETETGNFPKGRHVFRVIDRSVYPGHRGGNQFPENLTTYEEDPVFFKGTDAVRASRLIFAIERVVKWDPSTWKLDPFTYSVMMDVIYPVSRWESLGRESRPTVEEFTQVAESLPGFAIDEQVSKNGQPTYRNPSDNLFINWSRMGGRKICIGVIQQKPVPNLITVTEETIPHAVEIFNRLSPTKKIGEELVRKSIEAAIEGSKIIPQLRT